MPRRFALELLDAARDAGLDAARLRHAHSGPRLVGRMHGRRVSLPLPAAAGTPLKDGVALARLRRALERAADGASDPWARKPRRRGAPHRKVADRRDHRGAV